jgi:pimeloyl-ACP methyl ester carboxylesterase
MSSLPVLGPIGKSIFNRRRKMTVVEKVKSKDGTGIAYDRLGDGPALVLVGAAWNDRISAVPLAQLLADEYSVYTYDRRGRGDSGDTQPYAVEREIEDLTAVIEAAGGSAYAFGVSSGAALALEAAAAGAPISKLAMYEPPYIVDDSRPPIPDDYVEHLDQLASEGKRNEILRYFMTAAVGMPAEMVDQMAESPMAQAMEPLAHTVAYDGRVMLRAGMSGKPLPARFTDTVTVPTLVMDGGASPTWMRNTARALNALLPDVEYRTLDGQDHAAPPEVLAPEIEKFFA